MTAPANPWVSVPFEPTEEMLDAAEAAWRTRLAEKMAAMHASGKGWPVGNPRDSFSDTWAAMVRAALSKARGETP